LDSIVAADAAKPVIRSQRKIID